MEDESIGIDGLFKLLNMIADKDYGNSRKIGAAVIGGLAFELDLKDPAFFFEKVVNDAKKNYAKPGFNPHDKENKKE